MSLAAACTGLVGFLGYALGAFGWYRMRRGDFITPATFDTYTFLQRIGPVIGTFATAAAIALQTAGAP